jgi:polysaccharide biosynthesis protein PslG
LRKRIGVFTAVLVAAASLGVAAASAHHVLVGIQDDAQTTYGNPVTTFATLQQLHVQVVRVNLVWGGNHGVANERRPAHPQDPSDPAYDWTLYDRVDRYAAQYGIKLLFTILFTPKWAGGGDRFNNPPNNMNDLRNFAYAAAERYGGHYIPTNETDEVPLPPVRLWLAWNEPNNPLWLKQTSGGRFVSPREYAGICNAIYTGVHFTNYAGEQVACGATGPRGNNQPRSSRPSISPLAFMVAARKAGMRQMDAYAHHPYYSNPSQSPAFKPPDRSTIQLGNLRTLIALSNKLFGKKPIWITEYGYQTPPDNQFGVSYAKQARYLAQAYAIARSTPQVAMMVWFMLKDDTNISQGWQSGLLTPTGKKKPAYNVFARLPR